MWSYLSPLKFYENRLKNGFQHLDKSTLSGAKHRIELFQFFKLLNLLFQLLAFSQFLVV